MFSLQPIVNLSFKLFENLDKLQILGLRLILSINSYFVKKKKKLIYLAQFGHLLS